MIFTSTPIFSTYSKNHLFNLLRSGKYVYAVRIELWPCYLVLLKIHFILKQSVDYSAEKIKKLVRFASSETLIKVEVYTKRFNKLVS